MSPAASLCLFLLGVACLANAAPAPAEPEGDNVDRAAKVAKFLYDALNAEMMEEDEAKESESDDGQDLANNEAYGYYKAPQQVHAQGYGYYKAPQQAHSQGYGYYKAPEQVLHTQGYGYYKAPEQVLHAQGYGYYKAPQQAHAEGYGYYKAQFAPVQAEEQQ